MKLEKIQQTVADMTSGGSKGGQHMNVRKYDVMDNVCRLKDVFNFENTFKYVEIFLRMNVVRM